MRIIVITDTSFAASEAESIRILLLEGADRVHLRKPQSAEADMRRLIEALAPELYLCRIICSWPGSTASEECT